MGALILAILSLPLFLCEGTLINPIHFMVKNNVHVDDPFKGNVSAICKRHVQRYFDKLNDPTTYLDLSSWPFQSKTQNHALISNRDTTIQRMTIRRMLIERHFWLHC